MSYDLLEFAYNYSVRALIICNSSNSFKERISPSSVTADYLWRFKSILSYIPKGGSALWERLQGNLACSYFYIGLCSLVIEVSKEYIGVSETRKIFPEKCFEFLLPVFMEAFFANKCAFSLPLILVCSSIQHNAILFSLPNLIRICKHSQTNFDLIVLKLSTIRAIWVLGKSTMLCFR